MTSSFTDTLFAHLQAVVPDGVPVSRSRLGQPDIPRPIGHFLQLTLDRRVAIQCTDLDQVAAGWVDHRAADVATGREAFVELMKTHAQFPVDEWPRMLRQAVDRVVAHLVRPVPTLVQFLYLDASGPVHREDLIRRVGYFVAHPYLRSATETALERSRTATMDQAELADALERVEHAVVAKWSPDDWEKALAPLAELALLVDLDGIPLDLLDTFFETKGVPLLAARVAAHGRRSGKATLPLDEVRDALAGEPEPETSRPVDQPATSAGPKPLWQQFRPGTGPQGAEQQAPSSGEPLWKRFAGPVDDASPTTLSQLEFDVLGTASSGRDTFVSELFGGSGEEYEQLLARLYAATTWAAASKILGEDLFRKNKLDIYSPAAVDFTNAVEDRYRRDV